MQPHSSFVIFWQAFCYLRPIARYEKFFLVVLGLRAETVPSSHPLPLKLQLLGATCQLLRFDATLTRYESQHHVPESKLLRWCHEIIYSRRRRPLQTTVGACPLELSTLLEGRVDSTAEQLNARELFGFVKFDLRSSQPHCRQEDAWWLLRAEHV